MQNKLDKKKKIMYLNLMKKISFFVNLPQPAHPFGKLLNMLLYLYHFAVQQLVIHFSLIWYGPLANGGQKSPFNTSDILALANQF